MNIRSDAKRTESETAPSTGPTHEIAFDKIRPTDSITLQTVHHTYRFIIVDPSSQYGLLSDRSGDHPTAPAIFMGLRGQHKACLQPNTISFRVGARALFLIKSGNQARHLITSAITALSHVQAPS